MAQTPELINTLKKQLKAHGKTYADVAAALDLSEAQVKRLFASEHFTLQRLEAVCRLIDIDLVELFQLMASQRPQLQQLTREQEQQVVSDIRLLMVALNVINGYTFDELLRELPISQHECVQHLATLDRLQIIELLPSNRIKLRIAPNFHWIINGPIQTFFHEQVERDFFRSRFDKQHEKLLVLNGLLSADSNREMQRNMARLAQQFNEGLQNDSGLPLDQKHGNTLVVAIRHWQWEALKNA
ncbi:MAG: helix-turn-helix transcriptional regulator [Pseudomonadota bacterium]